MTQLRQLVAASGVFLAMSILLAFFTVPYFRAAERQASQASSQTPAHTVARMQ